MNHRVRSHLGHRHRSSDEGPMHDPFLSRHTRSRPGSVTGRSTTASPRKQYTVKVNHLPPDVSEREVGRYYDYYGSISSLKVIPSSNESYALINYETESSADRAIRHTNGKKVFGRVVRVVCKWKDNDTPIEDQYTLKVTNLSPDVTQEEMEHVCRSYSDYQNLKVNEGYAYVNFSSLEGAERAMAFLRNVTFRGQCPIVKLQDKKSQQPTFQSLTRPDFRPNIPPIPPQASGCIPPIPPHFTPPILPPPPIPPVHIPPPACIPSIAPHARISPFPAYPSSQTLQQGKSSTVKVTLGSGRITGITIVSEHSQP